MKIDPVIQEAGAHRLGSLLHACQGDAEVWSEQDITQMVEHQLDAPIDIDLKHSSIPDQTAAPGATTLRGLLANEPLDLRALSKIGTFYKACVLHPNSNVPPPVAQRIIDNHLPRTEITTSPDSEQR